MKKLLLASVAVIGFAGAAAAADLPRRTAPVAPMVAAVPVFTWTGFYVGVNAGYGWTNTDEIVIPGVGIVTTTDGDDGGFIGGAQVGFNYQMGAIVVGVEGDLQYADIGNATYVVPGVGTFSDSSDDWFGTLRGRVGFALDRALIYATGGIAFADGEAGWALGGGIEYAFTNNLSAKLEGLYVSRDDQDRTFGGVVVNGGDADFTVVRVGLNYRFGTY